MAESKYEELWSDVKKFLTLQYDYVKLSALEKMVLLLSAMALFAVMLLLSACVLFYLSFALVYMISDMLGCVWGAYLIVSAIFLILVVVTYAMRKKIIIDPVSRFLTKLFLDKNK